MELNETQKVLDYFLYILKVYNFFVKKNPEIVLYGKNTNYVIFSKNEVQSGIQYSTCYYSLDKINNW